jgi:hypothetical protein
MKTFMQVLSEIVVHKEKWGSEITGTVAEVIEALKRLPQDAECTAGVIHEHTTAQHGPVRHQGVRPQTPRPPLEGL